MKNSTEIKNSTSEVLLKVIGCKILEDEIANELELEDPDKEKTESIMKDNMK